MGWKIIVTWVTAIGVTAVLAETPRPPMRTSEGPILPRIELLRTVGAAYPTFIADYYWLATIQQVGKARRAEEYRDVYFYADHATSLDPMFRNVYPFGAIGVTHNLGRERWVNTEESTRLLEKALIHFPKDLQFKFLLAHNLMYYQRDYQRAADIIAELSREPDAPEYLAPLATRLYAQGGAFDVGLQLAMAMRDGAADEESREFFEQRVLEIHLERVLQVVDAAASGFESQHGRRPTSVKELLDSGALAEAPVDPLGGEIQLDEHGRGSSSSINKRLRLIHQNPQWIEDP